MAHSAEPSDLDGLEAWEQDLIKSVAASFGTVEREDLESELAWRLLVLKRQRPSGIRNWRAYIYRFLRNKALNWLRKSRPRERSTVSLDLRVSEGDSGDPLAERLQVPSADEDHRLALNQAISELSPELQLALRILIEENWNQSKVAKRLHKHRNTIRDWIRRIRQTLIDHGFGPADTDEDRGGTKAIARVAKPESSGTIALSWPLVKVLTAIGHNGTQWRLFLWLAYQCAIRKQRTIAVSWHFVAQELGADRATVRRAAQGLLRSGLLVKRGKRLSLNRNRLIRAL